MFEIAKIFCAEFGHDWSDAEVENFYWYEPLEFKFKVRTEAKKTCSRCLSVLTARSNPFDVCDRELMAMPQDKLQLIKLLGHTGTKFLIGD